MKIIKILAYTSLAIQIIAILLIVLPLNWTKRIRHGLAGFVMYIWIGDSQFWSTIHKDLWQKGNGP